MIKVASYNMHKSVGLDRRRDPERTLNVLKEIDADIIALQEADRRFGRRMSVIAPHLLDEHTDWKPVPVTMRPMSMGWHGNVLLVRKDARIEDCEPIHLPALEPRGAVMADIRVKGALVRVVGMHLDLSGLWRRRQAHMIMSHVDSCARRLPTVMMGDLNEWTRKSGCLRDFARGFDFADCGPSFHARRPVARLDRIMVSRDAKIAAAGVHASAAARTASDHLPIWAEISL
ncbi:endonuclease/exonuclease/phosphatase family protein [Stakelama sp. CBK3Z-3]|uniref:Endonuclease/exonuclease/phosphatase family protein n=1 Tax=Stakelama flava TaxID=2860338 RepID=A0ABS6XHN0_9SPHN|nr:endonuclease/exonuclease/phosphatase family protein [Stakelama flava]MBW4329404.1 endonuclease/exonuclease/phosphatase family protein [Stakelama flava]